MADELYGRHRRVRLRTNGFREDEPIDLDELMFGGLEIVEEEHASDCALHNEPAIPRAPCNCRGKR